MPAKKKYQIFVSSTFADMKEERQAAVEAILAAGHIPAGMELFAAGDEEQLEVVKRWIDESDIYVLLLGARYGSIEPISRLSYTEVEYDYAVGRRKPFCALVLSEKALTEKANALPPIVETDEPAKLASFRQKVLRKISRLVDDCKDIKIFLPESIRGLEGRHQLLGWIRSDDAPYPAKTFNLAGVVVTPATVTPQVPKDFAPSDPQRRVLMYMMDRYPLEVELQEAHRVMRVDKTGLTPAHAERELESLHSAGIVSIRPLSDNATFYKLTKPGRDFMLVFLDRASAFRPAVPNAQLPTKRRRSGPSASPMLTPQPRTNKSAGPLEGLSLPGSTLDSRFLLDLDPATMSEVPTKFELAHAYIDMRDPEGARSILAEILGEGNAEQKREARRLMDTLPK